MSTTKKVATQETSAVTIEKNNNKLSQMGMVTLQMIVLQQKPADKITEAEKEFLNSLNANVTPEIIQELEALKLIQKDETGNYRATGYGVKWVLETLSYGKQFDKMVESLTLDAQFRLFFTLIKKLDEKLENTVNYLGKDGKPSTMWKGLIGAANTIDSWCEEEPETTSEKPETAEIEAN